ncbi:MAG: carboxypeptidase regulatory-like domain-containing protein, partial [Candidatus Cloacimonetes bacterium]|nr:carboxypeptidase regulatory-like domain-containing protein [Candidatus Cloacimonadota bacterium]
MGETALIRWHFGTDSSVNNYPGWYIDDVILGLGDPPPYGALQGTVTDPDGIPIEDAQITVMGALHPLGRYSVETDPFGYYQIDPIIAQFYDFTCECFPYYTVEDTFTVFPDSTLVYDVVMGIPEIWVHPEFVTITLNPNTQGEEYLTVSNLGTAPLEWYANIEFPEALIINIPPATTDFPRSKDKLSLSLAPQNGEPTNSSTTPMINPLRGTTAYAFNVYPGSDFVTFDTDDPGTWLTTIPMTYSPFAADFDIDDNFYAIDYYTINLYAVDIETGVFTLIGPTQASTDLACDKTDGTMYAASYYGSNSYLYTIDLTTGSATLIGLINAGGLIISMACDGEGNLWGFDIVDDALYAIDKDDGHGTYVGSVGFDGNYAQSMSWDPESDIVYMAAYNNTVGAGQLRIVDTSTGATALVGTFNGGAEVAGLGFQGGGTPPWIWLSEYSGIVPAGGDSLVTVFFDAI